MSNRWVEYRLSSILLGTGRLTSGRLSGFSAYVFSHGTVRPISYRCGSAGDYRNSSLPECLSEQASA